MALHRASPEDRPKLIELEAELDALTHSRQQGINFGELSALTIFAGLIISLALFARPDVSGVTAFLLDMFSILLSAVIIFLTFGIGDLQRDRIARIMLSRSSSTYGEYEVLFQDETRRYIEQGISVVVGLFIVGAYAGLLGTSGWAGSADAIVLATAVCLVLQSQLVSKGMDQPWLPQRSATGNVFSSNGISQYLKSKVPSQF